MAEKDGTINGSVAELAALRARVDELERWKRGAQRRSASRRLIGERIGTIIWEMNPDRVFTWVSSPVMKLLAYSPEEVVGRSLESFLTPRGAEAVASAFVGQDARRRAGEPMVVELDLIAQDGRAVPFEISSVSHLDDQGRVVSYRGVARDITDRRTAEEARRESEDRYRTLFDASPISLMELDVSAVKSRIADLKASGIVDLDQFFIDNPTKARDCLSRLRFVRVNNAACALFEAPSKEALAEGFRHFANNVPLEVVSGMLRPVDEGKDDLEKETFIITNTGKRVSVYSKWSVMPGHEDRRERILASDIDITKMKETEDALKTSKIQLSQAMELARIVYWVLDAEAHEFVFNDAFYNLYGTTAEQEGGYRMNDDEYARRFVHPDDLPAFFASAGRNMANTLPEFVAEVEHRMIRKDGEVRHILAKMKVVRGAAGNIVQIYGANQDITEHKRAEKALEESAELYTRLVDTLPDVVVRTDLEGTVLFVNDYTLQISGYNREELEGRKMLMFVSPKDWDILMQNSLLMMENRLGPKEYRLIMKDGREIPFEVNGDVLRSGEGTPFGLVFVCRDITERKRAEDALQTSSIQLAAAMDLAHIVYWTLDPDTHEFIFNDAFYRFHGTTVEREGGYRMLTEEYARRFVHPDDLPIYRRSAEEHRTNPAIDLVSDNEHRIVRRDGEVRHTTVKMRVIKDTSGRIVRIYGATQDITGRKRAEEEQEKLQAQLHQAQKMESVGRLAGGVAHDFNNILTAILGYTELAMTQSRTPEQIQSDLKIIESSALHSADLVRQLLAFARKQTIAPQVLDLNDTMSGMIKMLQRMIGEDISFGWMPGRGLWPVKIDPSQLDQLLANLCVNARDAITGVGRITIETDNTVFDQAYCDVHAGFIPGEYVMITVSDNGCGMSKDTIAHIFEPFFTTKEMGRGTGLGLATVYGIVKQNNGFINLYSEPGIGSTFKIYLPRFLGEVVEPAAPASTEMPRARGETVLMVEDDMVVLTLGKAILEALGYTILTADLPGEALRLAEIHGNTINLLITDVIMPEMNGRDLAHRLSEMIPGLRCLFASGYTANAIVHQGVLDAGVNFIAKPFSVKSLATKVREVLDREQAQSSRGSRDRAGVS